MSLVPRMPRFVASVPKQLSLSHASGMYAPGPTPMMEPVDAPSHQSLPSILLSGGVCFSDQIESDPLVGASDSYPVPSSSTFYVPSSFPLELLEGMNI
jgi:hypothetical protein